MGGVPYDLVCDGPFDDRRLYLSVSTARGHVKRLHLPVFFQLSMGCGTATMNVRNIGLALVSSPVWAQPSAQDLVVPFPVSDGPPTTTIELNLETMRGVARVGLEAGRRHALSIDGIEVVRVRTHPQAVPMSQSRTLIEVPSQTMPVTLEITYIISQGGSTGWLAGGQTLTWPADCGRLFPCEPAPARGRLYTLSLEGLSAGDVAIHPTHLGTAAPAYQVAWAVGPYLKRSLGHTPAGTEVLSWHQAPDEAAVRKGTANLVETVAWLEQTLGAYAYGPQIGAVIVPDSASNLAMEHHPFWHVPASRGSTALIHAHEAAHGWFGNGVRIQCWEDLVLSEGTASYLAAKSVGAVQGAVAEAQVWLGYAARLDAASRSIQGPVLKSTCGSVNVEDADLLTPLTYMRGAFFFKRVEEKVGSEALLAALASFYIAHAGDSVRMMALVRHIEQQTAITLIDEVSTWLTAP